jgi:hypothetical protein
MEGGGEPFPPFAFLMCLREKFPQFAQTGQGGIHAQQDAEECMTSVMQALRERLKASEGMGRTDCQAKHKAPPVPANSWVAATFASSLTTLFVSCHQTMQNGDGSSKIEELFGIKTTLKLKCEESGEELQVGRRGPS